MAINLNNLLPGVDQYLTENTNIDPVTINGLEDLVLLVKARTGLKKAYCEIIITTFFNEIRRCMLQEKIVAIDNLGRFVINTGKLFSKAVFKSSIGILKKLNNK